MSKRSKRISLILAALALCALAVVHPCLGSAEEDAGAVVQRAWQKAQEVGAYHYATTIVQTTRPTLRVENAGQAATEERIYIEGETNVADETMRMRLWSGDGNVSSQDNSIELKVEQGVTWGRVGDEQWRKVKAGTALFAPGNDLLGYLAGAKDVRSLGTETRAGVTFTRYAFTVDGPAFAEHIRGQLEEEMRRSGELPPGIDLKTPSFYADMTGEGEIWLNQDGLPLREIVSVQFPPTGRDEVEARITTDFHDWASQTASGPLGLPPVTARHLRQVSMDAGLFGGVALFLLTVLVWQRSRAIYVGLVSVLIFSMVVVPVVQAQKVFTFTARQRAEAQVSDQEAAQSEALQKAQQATTAQFDPHANPLDGAAPDATALTPFESTTLQSVLADNAPGGQDDADTDGDGLTDAEEADACTESGLSCAAGDTACLAAAADSDGDGLSDGTEIIDLGTNPCMADSDGDHITDLAEVEGFELYGVRWYLNPRDPDTNHDGISDLDECFELSTLNPGGPSGPCPDTDGDGDPDVFDQDDDGDGVPDSQDLARTTVVGGGRAPTGQVLGLANRELNLSLTWSQKSLDTPVFVDLQFRPTKPSHLWYSLSVLDWPSGDRDGQIKRVLDSTFADSNAAAGQDSGPKDDQGDMRLVPMLEIEIPYTDASHHGNLPTLPGAPPIAGTTPITAWLDTAQTDAFNMSVRYKDGSSQPTLLIYAPVTLVRDPNGNSPIAFSARILYRPDVLDFGKAQIVRLVWLVEAITDYCAPPAGQTFDDLSDAETESWCADDSHWRSNPPRVIHSYYDDWYLTGLSVREDHGVDVAVVFENADSPHRDPTYERWLWQVATNLSDTFVTGRASGEGDTRHRDITVPEIARRFALTSTATIDERWGITPTYQVLNVKTFSFPDQTFLAELPMTHTTQILDDYFLDANGAPKVDAPTLLYAREEHYRSVNLGQAFSGLVAGNTLNLSLSPTDAYDEVMAGLNWAPYRFDAASASWEPYPIEEYWSYLESALGDLFADIEGDPEGFENRGRIILAQNYYLALYHGLASVVEAGNAIMDSSDEGATDAALSSNWLRIKNVPLTIVKQVISGAIEAVRKLPTRLTYTGTTEEMLLAAIGGAKEKLKASWIDNIFDLEFYGKKVPAGIALAAGAAVGGVVVIATYAALGGAKGEEIVFAALQAIDFTMAVKDVLDAALDLYKANFLGEFRFGVRYAIKSATVDLRSAANVAAVIGLVISAGVSIGFFVAQMITSGVRFASLEFDQALAAVVAGIIVSVIMFAIGLIPVVGQIIVAIIGLIDAVIGLICKLTGLDQFQADEPDKIGGKIVRDYICAGISGALSKLVQFLIYSQNPIVNLEKEDRLQIQGFSMDLQDHYPTVGFVEGNKLKLSATVTTTLYRHWPVSALAYTYAWQYANEYLKKAAFVYNLASSEQDLHVLQGLTTSNPQTWYGDYPFHRVTPLASGYDFPLTPAGINVKVPAYLNEGYAVKAQECFLVPNPLFLVTPAAPPVVPVCYLRDKTDSLHMDLNLVFDILPTTVDGFFALAAKDGGYALAWGQSGDLRFPALMDADGDDLISPAFGGNDPSDRTADTDGDGLSDLAEVRWGSDPTLADSDGDGLSDYDEHTYGTDPQHADTDHDGLKDGAELKGWEFVYGFDASGAPLITRVTSDPLMADTDGDGLTDKLENVYGMNPRVPGPATVLTIESTVSDEDGLVKPGDTIAYMATIANELRDRYALGLLEVDFPPAAQGVNLVPKPYELGPLAKTTLAGDVTVSPLAASQQISLTNRAGAIIANIREAVVQGRTLWLHLDEAAGATRFADASLNGHDGTCAGSACPTAGGDGYFLRALNFHGDDRVTSGVDVSEENFTLSLWFKTSCDNCGIASAIKAGTVRHDRDLYLHNGDVCAKLGRGTTETICTSGIDYADDAWHHVAYVFGGPQGNQALFVDGERRASGTLGSSDFSGENAVALGYAAAAGTDYLTGRIDEVEIYPRVLSADEIRARFKEPVLHVTFDASSASHYRDVSSHGHPLDCSSWGICPAAGSAGVIAQAVSFDQKSYLAVSAADDSLNLHRGKGMFTIAAWVKPQSNTSGWVGVFGKDDHDHPERSYPSLYTNTSLRRFKATFGNGSQLCEVLGDPNAFTLDRWQHVAAVFDGTNFTLYRNGVAIGSSATCAGTKPYGTSSLEIGRTSNAKTITFDKLVVRDEGDGSGKAEYNGSVDNTTVWGLTDVVPGTYSIPYAYTVYGDWVHTVSMTELDASIEEPARDGDDLEIIHTVWPYDIGQYSEDYTTDGEGTLTWSVSNTYYKGKLDDLRIYRFALDNYEIKDLYQSATRLLELRLDEPPGATVFADHSGNGEAGTCDGSRCPVTGVAGRSNQAVHLDGTDDRIQVSLDAPDTDVTFSFWFKSKDYGDQCANCGLLSVVADNGQREQIYLNGGKVCAKVAEQTICSASPVSGGQWHYVAHTIGDTVGGQNLYVDGTLVASGSQTTFGLSGATELRLGQANAAGQEYFEGYLDHVIVTRRALGASAVAAQQKEIAVLNLHLDEAQGATAFRNEGDATHNATCNPDISGVDSCPDSGTDGWIRGALQFDGIDDKVTYSGSVPGIGYTVALWVKPTQRRAISQTLLTREDFWQPSTRSLGLFIEPDSMTLRYQDCHKTLESTPNALLENQWNHVVLTYGDDGLAIYVNGALDSILPPPLWGCPPLGSLYIGGTSVTGWGLPGSLPFAGQMDEVAIYGRTLSAREVEALYNYQVSWVDVSAEHRITVDAEPPTVAIDFTAPAVDMSPDRVIAIEAQDATTSVERVQYRVNGGAWQDATPDGAAWLFYFTPTQEGPVTIEARAIDSVGHWSTIAGVTFEADGSPPAITIDSATTQRTLPIETVADLITEPVATRAFPASNDVIYGTSGGWWYSGAWLAVHSQLDTNMVNRVDLHLEFENRMGPGQTASFNVAVNNEEVGTFEVAAGETQKDLSFTFAPKPRMYGDYYYVELAMPTGTNIKVLRGSSTITFFAPRTRVRQAVELSGGVRDRGGAGVAAVWIDLRGPDDVSLGGRQAAVLSGERWRIAYVVPDEVDGRYTVQMGTTDAVGNTVVRQEETLRLDGTAPDAVVTHADDEGGLMTGVGDDAPVLTGTAVDVPYPSGRALSYQFAEPAGSTAFGDGSGRRMTAACSGTSCPAAGETGRVGAGLRFSGDDYLIVADQTVTSTADVIHAFEPEDYTVAFWFNTTAPGPQTIFAATVPGDTTRGLWVGVGPDGRLTHIYQPLGTRTVISSTGSVNDGTWHHVAAVKRGTTIALFIDGIFADWATVSNTFSGPLDVAIGRRSQTTATEYFIGGLDELLVYQRALPDERIQALAQSVAAGVDHLSIGFRHAKGAALYEKLPAYLPLDASAPMPGEEGRSFTNLGSLSQPAWCEGATCPAIVATGMVDGAATFDGATQALTLGPVTLGGPLTFAAWVRPDATDGTRTIIYHGIGAAHEGPNFTLRIKDSEYQVGQIDPVYGDNLATYPVPAGDVGSWVHLAGVRTDYGCWYLYRNSEWVGISPSCWQSPGTRQVPLTIGAEGFAPTNFFAGALDEVAIYNRALVPYEIEALADSQRWRDVPLAEGGAPSSTWAFTVAGIEGPHQVDLKVTDAFGHVHLIPKAWAGELDTAAPRLSLSVTPFAGAPDYTTYHLAVEDYNLRGHTFTDVNGKDHTITITARMIDDPWYTALYSETRLVALDPLGQSLPDRDAPYTLSACDIFGQCASVSAGPGGVVALQTAPAPQVAGAATVPLAAPTATGEDVTASGTMLPPLHSVVLSPPDGVTYATLDPLEITGYARAINALQALTVSVNGAPISVTTWATSDVTETFWSKSWAPPAEGVYTITTQVTDWAGSTTADTAPVPSITVDTTPPVLVLATSVISSADFTDAGYAVVHGLVSDTLGVDRLQVRYNADPWANVQVPTDTTAFTGAAWTGSTTPPDGEWATLHARATDKAGNTTEVSRTVWVDAQPPAPVTMTLSYLDPSSVWRTITAGTTIRDVPAPTLGIAWTGSASGDVVGYLAGWSPSTTPDSTLTPYGPLIREHHQGVGEAQRLYAHLVTVDTVGNRTVQTTGAFYIDYRLTPAYTGEGESGTRYSDWLEEPCNLIGVDRRAATRNGSGQTLTPPVQRFYATADGSALDLAWTGADWDVDGDLFIYFDTTAGGSAEALNPYLDDIDTHVYLPGVTPPALPGGVNRSGAAAPLMEADRMVWVKDNHTAWLWRWDGSDWVTQTQLSPVQFHYDPALRDGQTELSLSFDLLGLPPDGSSSLRLVAFVSDEDHFRLWATMPSQNPVNSAAAGPVFVGTASFALARGYQWPTFGSGTCPGGQSPDVDVALDVTSDPGGSVARYLGDGLATLWDPMFGTPPADVSTRFTFADTHSSPLGVGHVVTYSVTYRNRGSVTAEGVRIVARAHYGLRLLDSASDAQTFLLGNVDAGDAVTITLRGMTQIASEPWAALDLLTYDDAHPEGGPPVEWAWVDHPLDDAPPTFSGIQAPSYLVPTGTTTLRGYAYDASGVPLVNLRVQTPANGTRSMTCPDTTPSDGSWSCPWDLTGSNGGTVPQDGDTFHVQIQATDAFGQSGAWSYAYPFLVDALPPTLSLTLPAGQETLSAVHVQDLPFALRGTVEDNHGLGKVVVCESGSCRSAQLLLDPGPPTVLVNDAPHSGVTIGGGAGCIERSFIVSDTLTLGEVRVGLVISHTRRGEVTATLTSPAHTQVTLLDGDDNDAAQHYDVLLRDAVATPLHTRDDDDPSAPAFERVARPASPLQAFLGEQAAGTWTLRLCDGNPGVHDGQYLQGRLILVPQDTASRSGHWYYPVFEGTLSSDYVERSLTVYAVDAVGNRTTSLDVRLIVDATGPDLTVTEWPDQPVPPGGPLRMAGTVSDTGGISAVRLIGTAPNGAPVGARIAPVGETWVYTGTTPFTRYGTYTLFIEAEDTSGNQSVVGPLPLTVQAEETRAVYLPLVLRDYVTAPDLIVDEIRSNPNTVEVVIRNRGNAPVVDAFWVDLYVAPSPAPTAVNQLWEDFADQGLVWGVEGDALPLMPGDELTLRVGDAYFWGSYSHVEWPLALGTVLYAQVDSANANTTYGAVLEGHEIEGTFYNNLDVTTVGEIDVVLGAADPAETLHRPFHVSQMVPRGPSDSQVP